MADTAITFPEYDQWSGTPEWRTCLLEHNRWRGGEEPGAGYFTGPGEDCPGCAARLLLPAIYDAWHAGDAQLRSTLWALQDGYGTAGLTPEQGYDWSGIRDSSPAAILRMAQAIAVPA